MSKSLEIYRTLVELFPEESFCSYSAAFRRGLKEGIISLREYERGREYYGALWNYCGD